MNIDALRMFIMIVQKGSISAAAQEMGYAQSNISTKVKNLESDLQTQLFYRNARGVSLTNSGQELYVQALKIIGLTDATINKIQHPNEVEGKLHIGTLQTAASTFLPTILAQYHLGNPEVELRIETGTTLMSAQRVLNYELDGAIIGGIVNEKNLFSIPLMNEKICLIMANDHQVDIQNDSLLVFPNGCAYRKVLESWLDSQKIMIHHPIEFNYLNAIVASVSSGLGISVLPKRVIRPYVDNGVIKTIDLPTEYATLPVSFIYRKDYIVNQAFNKLLQLLKN